MYTGTNQNEKNKKSECRNMIRAATGRFALLLLSDFRVLLVPATIDRCLVVIEIDDLGPYRLFKHELVVA